VVLHLVWVLVVLVQLVELAVLATGVVARL
jgi:hypothetical protein